MLVIPIGKRTISISYVALFWRFVGHSKRFENIFFCLTVDFYSFTHFLACNFADWCEPMVRQCESLLFCQKAHRSVEVVAACKVQQGKPVLVLRVHFDVDSSVKRVFFAFTNTHVHLRSTITRPCATQSFFQKTLFFKKL